MTDVRYPPVFWPDDLAEREDAWDTADPLGIDGAEYVARDPKALEIALSVFLWLCTVGIIWSAGALLAWAYISFVGA
jgi:hypothetical protein